MNRAPVFLVGVLAIKTALASQPACPKLAPDDWGIGQMPLESVRVLSYPANSTPNADREYYAMPPSGEREKTGFIYQTWQMNRDIDKFKYEVDCVYMGTARYVSLDVTGTRLCVARWRARHDHGVVPRSLDFFCKK